MSELTKSAKKLFEYIQGFEELVTTRDRLSRILNVTTRTITRNLHQLTNAGLVSKIRGQNCITIKQNVTSDVTSESIMSLPKGSFRRNVTSQNVTSEKNVTSQLRNVTSGLRNVTSESGPLTKLPKPTIIDKSSSTSSVSSTIINTDIHTTDNSSTLDNTCDSNTKPCISMLYNHNQDCDVPKQLCEDEMKNVDSTQEVSVESKAESNQNLCPAIPPTTGVEVSEVVVAGGMPPYPKKGYNVSAIWYWAIQRYKLHGHNFRFTQALFRKMATKYARTLGGAFGKDFEEHKKHIDWFLGQTDDFVRQQTKFGFDYMISSHCVNMRKEQAGNDGFIDSNEQRRVAGRWIK